MKKVITLLTGLLLLGFGAKAAEPASVLPRLNTGITAGMTSMSFDSASDPKIDVMAGITCQLSLPLGFSVQPSVLYMQKATKTQNSLALNQYECGYVEVPVAFQWGPDLLLFRPFIEAAPFVGYAVRNQSKILLGGTDVTTEKTNSWEGINRFSYGASLGAGIELWKIQIVYRHVWNLGSFADINDADVAIQATNINNRNFVGNTVSVAFFF